MSAIKSLAKRQLSRRPALYGSLRRARAFGLYLARKPHEADFAAFRAYSDDPRLFLDVGANIGQAAMSFRIFCRKQPILSIEPNPNHRADLRRVGRLVRNFDYRLCAAGAEPGSATLYVPLHGSLALTGEASLQPRSRESIWWLQQQGAASDGGVEMQTIDVEVLRLDDLALEPGFIKIDIEGGELACLRGLEKTITAHRPLVMIERSPGWREIGEFFAALDYVECAYDQQAGGLTTDLSEVTQNAFWVPSEQLDPSAL